MIDLSSTLVSILDQYKIEARGVIHIGAHTASEAGSYSEAGIQNVLWLEGNPSLMNAIEGNISNFPGQRAFNVIASDIDNTIVDFNVSRETQNSSILEPLNIQIYYPSTLFEERISMHSSRIDSFLRANHISIDNYNIVNIDIQGAELKALKGFGELLHNIDCINSEVNYTQLYRDGALMHQLDLYLAQYSLLRVKTELTKRGWGDALYIRVDSISLVSLWFRVVSSYSYTVAFQAVTTIFALLTKLNVPKLFRTHYPDLYAWLVERF